MDVVALAGGYGTRLGNLTLNTPKALLPINDVPLLTYTLAKLNKLDNIGTIYVVSNAKFFDQLQAWAKTAKSKYPIKVLNDRTTCNEDRLGSVGDLQFAIETENIRNEILLVGTDNFFTFDLNHVILRSHETKATTAGFYDVKDKEQAKNFGIGTLDKEGKVIDFVEKPQDPQSTLSLMLLWCIQPKDFPLIKECCARGKGDKAGNLIEFISKKSPVYGVVYDKPFYDIGSPEVYEQVQKQFKM